MEIESKQQILKRRKEIEQELADMLKETKSDFSLQDVKNAIFYEKDGDDIMMKIVAMFDRGGDISELSDILELVNDAWNYFPHKIINGLSPAEKLLEYEMNKPKKSTQKQTKKRGGGWKYFDNCPICQAMKEGRADTVEELKVAFDEANRISASKISKTNKI